MRIANTISILSSANTPFVPVGLTFSFILCAIVIFHVKSLTCFTLQKCSIYVNEVNWQGLTDISAWKLAVVTFSIHYASHSVTIYWFLFCMPTGNAGYRLTNEIHINHQNIRKGRGKGRKMCESKKLQSCTCIVYVNIDWPFRFW